MQRSEDTTKVASYAIRWSDTPHSQKIGAFVPRKFPHIKALDGVRGVAAFAVFLNHSLFSTINKQTFPGPRRFYDYLGLDYGVLAVDLFFVLSGYLITSLLLLDRREKHFYNNFYWKRVFRILPALVLVLALTYLWGVTGISTVVLALLFILNFNELLKIPASGPYWSLSIEEQFYLVWPSVVRHLSPRVMRRVLLSIIVAEPLLRALSTALHHGRTTYTFMHCDGLAWGALLAYTAYTYRVPWPGGDAKKLWRQFGRPIGYLGIVLAAIDICIRAIYGPYRFSIVLTWSCLVFASSLCYIITHRRSRVARALESKPLLFLGAISYMMYLSHVYLLDAFDRYVPVWRDHPTYSGYFLRVFSVLVATLLFCTASLYWFEHPLGKLRRHFVKHDRPVRKGKQDETLQAPSATVAFP